MGRQYRVNNEINEANVRVVSPDGSMVGVIPIADALQMAEQNDLDLVEVSPKHGNNPPVCKIIDFGKLRYEQEKKHKQPRPPTLKEIRCNFRISDHDLAIKNRKVTELLEKRHKVKYSIELRGREKGMQSAAMDKMKESLSIFEAIATWDTPQLVNGGKSAAVYTVISPR